MKNLKFLIPQSSRKDSSHRLHLRAVLKRLLPAAVMLLVSAACLTADAQTDFGSVDLGTTSAAQTVTLSIPNGGAITQTKVLTLGVASLDFKSVTDSCSSQTLPANGSCTVSITFGPTAVGTRIGAVVALDASGTVLGTAFLSGTGGGALGVLVPGTIVNVAGSSTLTGLGDGGLATNATLRLPTSVAEDGAGNIYIADSTHYRIREITVNAGTMTGNITTIAGTGQPGNTGDGGQAKFATFVNPTGVALDGAGNIYVVDAGTNSVRKIDGSTGIITTFAGSAAGTAGKTGDGGLATNALLDAPEGVTVNADGNVFIADTLNHRIRMVDVSSGIITTVAGDGNAGAPKNNANATSSALNQPYTVAFGVNGDMYIPDSANNVVEKVSNGILTIVAGTGVAGHDGDGASALKALLHDPTGVAVDPVGNLYIADTQNAAIRKVDVSTGFISRFAGTYTAGLSGNNGSAEIATLYGPSGLYLDPLGNLLVADVFNNRIRAILGNLATARSTTTPTRVGTESLPQAKAVQDIGTAALSVTSITAGTNTAIDAASTTCTAPSNINLGVSCSIGAEFAPTAEGNPLTGNITIQAGTPNNPLVIQVIGNATAQNTSTVTTLTSSQNPALVGSAITFTAVVAGQFGTPTGTVSFTSDGADIGSGTLDKTGTATLAISTLAIGQHTIVATYQGDADNSTSVSASLIETVQAIPTATVLVPTTTNSTPSQTILVATVVSTSGSIPTGNVDFVSGTTTLGSVALDATGAAQLPLSLAAGTYSVIAKYGGDATHSPSSSAAVSVTISPVASGLDLTLSSNTVTLQSGQNKTITVTLASVSGFADTIGLGCGSLPVTVTCHFSAPTVSLAANGTQKVQLTIDTNNPLSGGTTAKNESPLSTGSKLYSAGLLLPMAALLGVVTLRRTKRLRSSWLTLMILLVGGFVVSAIGCGGFTKSSAAPGTYTIQVTGVGQTSSVSSTQDVTLTITK